MAAGINFVSMALFFILLSVGPHFCRMDDYRYWEPLCKGLNFGTGIFVIFMGIPHADQKPVYTIIGVLSGVFSIYVGTVPFPNTK